MAMHLILGSLITRREKLSTLTSCRHPFGALPAAPDTQLKITNQ